MRLAVGNPRQFVHDSMVEARSYTCPGCGAHVAEQDRRCAHCDAPIATVRCASCFQMNAPDALHCSGCGGELGLEPIGESADVRCPSCAEPLVAFRGAGGALFDCARCGGQFAEHALLRELFARREIYGAAAPRPTPRPASTRPAPVHYVPCPACRALMNRKNFGETSGIIVDVCKEHGVWFDPGELPRVLAFVESGGLTRARERKREEERDRAKREALAHAFSNAPPTAEAHIETGLVHFVDFILGRRTS